MKLTSCLCKWNAISPHKCTTRLYVLIVTLLVSRFAVLEMSVTSIRAALRIFCNLLGFKFERSMSDELKARESTTLKHTIHMCKIRQN